MPEGFNNMKQILFFSIAILALNADANGYTVGDEGIDTHIGKLQQVLHDSVTKVKKDDHPLKDCVYFRDFKVKFEYHHNDHDSIYYYIYQCLNEDKVMTEEKVYFAYSPNGDKHPLPLGCPPPIIEPPKEEDPCQAGYQVGQVIAKTIAKIIVPQIVSENDDNPLNNEAAQKDIVELKKEIQTLDIRTEDLFDSFTEAQNGIMSEINDLVQDMANEVIECLTHKILEKKKVDIQFICTDQAAHENIHDAIEQALKDNLVCDQIDCQELIENLESGIGENGEMPQIYKGLEQIGDEPWTLEDSEFEEGHGDIDGNVQVPALDTNYLLYQKSKDGSFEFASDGIDGSVILSDDCNKNDPAFQFVFESYGNHRRILVNGLYMVNNEGAVELTDNMSLPLSSYLWRTMINLDNSLTIINVSPSDPVISAESSRKFSLSHLNNWDVDERFFVRTDCNAQSSLKGFEEQMRYGRGKEQGEGTRTIIHSE